MQSVGDFIFFKDTATTEIYTLALHDALPILMTSTMGDLTMSPWSLTSSKTGDSGTLERMIRPTATSTMLARKGMRQADRKSTRLNSSHANISYAVFCLKKNTTTRTEIYLSTN